MEENKEMKNRYALLIEGVEEKEATERIQDVLETMVKGISERFAEPGINIDPRQIGYCFYGNLHWGSIGENRLVGDEVVDKLIESAIEDIESISEDYPDAGIGDTMTDECIAYHVDELMQCDPIMHGVLLNRG